MLFLLFQIGRDRYALECAKVVEVLPLLNLKQLPKAPPGTAGILNFRGKLIPVMDLSEMASGLPSRRRLSTRLIVIDFSEEAGPGKSIGLIAEHLTETMRRDPEDFEATGVDAAGAPYLGQVTRDERGIIQRVDLRHLLSPDARAALFPSEGIA